MAASNDDYDKEIVDEIQSTGRTMNEADEAPIGRQIIASTVDEKAQDKIDSKANEEMAASNDDYDKEIVDEIQSTGRTMNEADEAPIGRQIIASTVDEKAQDKIDSKANEEMAASNDDYDKEIVDEIQSTGRTMNETDEAPIDTQIIAPIVDEKANEEVVDGAANEIQSTGEEDVDKGNVEVVVIDPSVPIVVQDDAHQEEEIDDAHSSGRTANESDEETDTKAKVAIVMNDDVKQADIDEVKMVNEADEVDTKANDDAVMSDDVALSGLNKEEVSDLLHRVLLEYNDSMEDDIKRIVNNKEIDGNALQEMVRKDNCNALASAFSILALDKTDWQKVYQSLKQMNEQQSIDI
eukprot:1074840_1